MLCKFRVKKLFHPFPPTIPCALTSLTITNLFFWQVISPTPQIIHTLKDLICSNRSKSCIQTSKCLPLQFYHCDLNHYYFSPETVCKVISLKSLFFVQY